LATPASARAFKRIVPPAARGPLRALATTLVAPLGRRRARELLARPPVRLNLGSGFAPVAGWTNVDLLGAPVDLPWHLARGLPFPDGTVDAVYSEHLFEHLGLDTARRLMAESVRVLRPGGVIRVAVPDAGLLLRSYAGTDDEGWALSRPTRMEAVMSLFYEHGHRTMYDAELLVAVVAGAGARDVRAMAFGESRLGTAVPDSEPRHDGTLYVEGVR
jgi:predicted SAM-dependent methyltransferase